MLRVRLVPWPWLFLIAWIAPPVAPADELPARVGAAKMDITPSYPVRLTGYGSRREESAGVAQRIWAKAVALQTGATEPPAVWLNLENCGLTPAIRGAVASRLKEQFGIAAERLVISVTHTHTAPCLTDWAPFIFGTDLPPDHRQHIDQYTRDVTEKLVRVAGEALAAKRPARLSWGRGKVSFAVNRRVLRDGTWSGFGVQEDGPVDHRLPVLVARDAEGRMMACVANYACHCTTLGGNFNQIAGDWAGCAQESIEANHPGCVAMVTIGCGADANPHPRKDDLEVCREQGRQVAEEVQRLVAGELKPLTGSLVCRSLSIELPFAAPRTEEEWRQRAEQADANGYHARHFLAKLARREPIPRTLPYPMTTWCFGEDLAMVFLAGEVVVDYAIRMHDEFDAERLWITAYSNDVPCYIPSRRLLREGGYEVDRSMVYYGRPQAFAPEVEDLILDAVQKLLPHSYYSAQKQVDFPPPRSPEESLALIQVRPGLRVELVAAEPLIEDPVAFDWAADGSLWVAEMRDYPNGMAWDKPGDRTGVAGGRVKLLKDTDGDGKYDQATVFLDEIPFPTGVKSWRSGVLVTAAPAILYAEDTDADGRADRQEVLYEGFGEGNQQHRVNGLRWGIDNWLYVANGDSGGQVRSRRTGNELSISGRDLRIRPDEGSIEAQSGQTQFGRCCDDWGNWFGGNNSNPMWHYVLDDYYLRRNAQYVPPAVRRNVPEVPGAAPVFPVSRTLARFNDFHTANRFTSACSPEIYRDQPLADVLGPGTHVLVCEPVHNLVHRAVLREDGFSFRSQRAADEQTSELFASADNWSRPVMVRTGPDGAIWIADMYRQVIEHPEWIPLTWQRKLDLRAGSDRGRIYRLVAQAGASRALPRLDQLDTAQLVQRLESSNGWQRDMAQQMLLWRQDPAAVTGLHRLLSNAPQATARLHAMATLDGLGKLTPAVLLNALRDSHPQVRRHAVRLSETVTNDDVVQAVISLSTDSHPQVRQQVAYSLGELLRRHDGVSSKRVTQVGRTFGEMLVRDGHQALHAAAIYSSLSPLTLVDMLKVVAAQPLRPEMLETLAAMVRGWENPTLADEVAGLLLAQAPTQPVDTRFAIVSTLFDLAAHRMKNGKPLIEAKWLSPARSLLEDARRLAASAEAETSNRVAAIRVLSRQSDSQAENAQLFLGLLAPQQPPEVQSAAVSALAFLPGQEGVRSLLTGWAGYGPTLRDQILDALFVRPATTLEVLRAIERGAIPASAVDARRRQQLAQHGSEDVRKLAAAVFGSASLSSRAQVLEQFQSVATMAGDAARGKEVFGKKCSTCHRMESVGQNVGPELNALTDKSPSSLLVGILDPNRAVENKYVDYLAVTADGRQFTGMIANETSSSLTLVGQQGKQVSLRRDELELLKSTGKSLMPEGLEKDLSPEDLANVIAYVRQSAAPPKPFPGNRPELAHVRDDGSIRLLAMNARIYGPRLVFEEKYRNLGYWQSPDDHAVWMLQVPKAGRYRVSVDYACEDQAAGDRFVISVQDQSVGGIVEGTGTWDNYRNRGIGSITLPEGYTELVIRADGPIRAALMDLRQIVLSPQ